MDQQRLFDGYDPEVHEMKLTGRASVRTEDRFRVGQHVFFLVVARCVGVGVEEKGRDHVLVDTHKFRIQGARRVDAAGEVADVLVGEAAAYLAALAEDDPSLEEGDDAQGGDAT